MTLSLANSLGFHLYKLNQVMSSNNSHNPTLKAGFVCLAGPTNAGKSTLMNAVVGEKISIITPKPQTTRNRILGIHTTKDKGQLIFIDTPGLHRPRGKLGKRMVENAIVSLRDTDVVLFVVDASLDVTAKSVIAPVNQKSAEMIAPIIARPVVALNKTDIVAKKDELLPVIHAYDQIFNDSVIIPISARTTDGLDRLESTLFERLPQSELLYPADVLSDQAERFMAAEIIREKLMMATEQELPYTTAVEIENWVEGFKKGDKPPTLSIAAVIHVERASQKGIVIGKGGSKLKDIGTKAREELEQRFATKVFLEIFVRVEKNWTNNPKGLKRLGY